MKKIILMVALAVMMLFGTEAMAEGIVLPDLISDHMMIQRDEPIKLWGTASSNTDVTVSLIKDTQEISKVTVTSQDDGRFDAVLPSVSDKGPYNLKFLSGSNEVIVSDVLAGDIWVQCGQSNMELRVSHCYPNTSDQAADIYQKDIMQDITEQKPTEENIRLFYNGELNVSSNTRKTDLDGEWKIVSYDSVYNYSAVGYSALNKLYKELNIPMGGICVAHGGASMESYQGPRKSGLSGGGLYNYKVAPLTQMNVKGVMWYQGEADNENKFGYHYFTERIIKRWRTDFNDETMPFIDVSFPASPLALAGFDYSQIRQAHLDAYYNTENVAMAVAIDLPGKLDDAHPGNKRLVGERMALAALGTVYKTKTEYSSPFFESVAAIGNIAVVKFSHTYDGLKTTDGQMPRMFRVAGTDGVFYDAVATISGSNTITLRCPNVDIIKTIAYAVENTMYETTADGFVDSTKLPEDISYDYMNVNLVNSIDLPLCPFVYDVNTTAKTAK